MAERPLIRINLLSEVRRARKDGMSESLFNAHPTGAIKGAQVPRRGHVDMRVFHAALLAVAGHEGAAMDGSKPAHNDWLVIVDNHTWKIFDHICAPPPE